MSSPLKQVLERFEQNTGPLSLSQMARELDVDPVILDQMIAFWVRKGKIRETSADANECTSCGSKSGCGHVATTDAPRRYVLVTTTVDNTTITAAGGPRCLCSG